MPALHESEYEKDMRRARRRIYDPDALVIEERRVRAMWCGLLTADIRLTGETKATGLRFIQRMHQLPSQGVHDKIIAFSEPLEGWIDRRAFEILWQERAEVLRAIQPVALTIEAPPRDEISEKIFPLWVFDALLNRYYNRVDERLSRLTIPWIDWDGVAPLRAREGVLNDEFVAALSNGPAAVEAWRDKIRWEFEADSRAWHDRIRHRRVRSGILQTFRIPTRGRRRERWIAWGWRGLMRGGDDLRD